MEAGRKSSAKAKKGAKTEQVEQINTKTKESQEFVDNLKKRATVKSYGIDNVRIDPS